MTNLSTALNYNSVWNEFNNFFFSLFTLFLFPAFMLSCTIILIGYNDEKIDTSLFLTKAKKINYVTSNIDILVLKEEGKITRLNNDFSNIEKNNKDNNEIYNNQNSEINNEISVNKNKNNIEYIDSIYNYSEYWLTVSEINIEMKKSILNIWKYKLSSLLGYIFAIIFFFIIVDWFCEYLFDLILIWNRIINYMWNMAYWGEAYLNKDILSLSFILLNGFIFPISHLSNWINIDDLKEYFIVIMLVLECLLTDVFMVNDFISFYVTFESTLPLLFFLIGLYGASQKFRAGFYIFLYTLLGSLFMLISFAKMGGDISSTSFQTQSSNNFNNVLQIWLWVALFISFSVKTPIVPAHLWLPLAHSDANVSGSILLASVVLKLALYGFIRILIGILHYCTKLLNPFVMAICALSVIYSSVSTIRQFDLKVLVAYSSIAHMGSTILGAFSDTLYGIVGSIIFGLAHGFVSPALFILVGAVLYDRCGSRIINYYRGLTNITPIFSLVLLFFLFGNMGVPLTANFIGEFLSLLAAFQSSIFIVSFAALSIVFSAVYSIFLFNRITSGIISTYINTIPDLFRREFFILLPLASLTIILGIYPYFITSQLEFGLSSFLLFTYTPIFFGSQINSNNSNLDYKNNFGHNNLKSNCMSQSTSDYPYELLKDSTSKSISDFNSLNMLYTSTIKWKVDTINNRDNINKIDSNFLEETLGKIKSQIRTSEFRDFNLITDPENDDYGGTPVPNNTPVNSPVIQPVRPGVEIIRPRPIPSEGVGRGSRHIRPGPEIERPSSPTNELNETDKNKEKEVKAILEKNINKNTKEVQNYSDTNYQNNFVLEENTKNTLKSEFTTSNNTNNINYYFFKKNNNINNESEIITEYNNTEINIINFNYNYYYNNDIISVFINHQCYKDNKINDVFKSKDNFMHFNKLFENEVNKTKLNDDLTNDMYQLFITLIQDNQYLLWTDLKSLLPYIIYYLIVLIPRLFISVFLLYIFIPYLYKMSRTWLRYIVYFIRSKLLFIRNNIRN